MFNSAQLSLPYFNCIFHHTISFRRTNWTLNRHRLPDPGCRHGMLQCNYRRLLVGLESDLLPYIPRLINNAHAILYHRLSSSLFFSCNRPKTIFVIVIEYKCRLHSNLALVVFPAHECVVHIPSYSKLLFIFFTLNMLIGPSFTSNTMSTPRSIV